MTNSTDATARLETRLTSFASLFGAVINDKQIRSIEIPLIQRDYAQGRNTAQVNRIRQQFIAAVCSSLPAGAAPIELDFVYGDVIANGHGDTSERGKFIPLDGQQRLTLLFLLHCYLAWRNAIDASAQPWSKFSYATRPGAREFCAFLVRNCPDLSAPPSIWIRDHADYLATWDFDPTIQSMLVVLDDLHDWFKADFQFDVAWQRITDEQNPAIQFHVLPMAENGMTDAQYIKMNSRGKPLTPFENFKARFEELLKQAHPGEAGAIALKLDTSWTNLIWPYRGDDNLVDDEFMRYFRFVCEICAWASGAELPASSPADELTYLGDLAERVFSQGAPHSSRNLDFLCHAFDSWHERGAQQAFSSAFKADRDAPGPGVLMFKPFREEGVNLFHACCRHYGSREWDLADSLLLYAMLLRWNFPRQDTEVPDFPKRLRMVRNLIEASLGDEIRTGERNNMPALLTDIEAVVLRGDIGAVSTFNKMQQQNELHKAAMLAASPSLQDILHEMEDHVMLMGGLTAFDLDPATFASHAQVFLATFDRSGEGGGWPLQDVSGALLANGDYSRTSDRPNHHLQRDMGAPRNKDPWQTLFRGKGRGLKAGTLRGSLMPFLDAIAHGLTPADVMQAYLRDASTRFDWRYYLVKYSIMRSGKSGRYFFSQNGYEACMLDKSQVKSFYMDPYLLAAVVAAGMSSDLIGNPKWPTAFIGYEDEERWLSLKAGLCLRSTGTGWSVKELSDLLLASGDWQATVDALLATYGARGLTVITTGDSATVLLPQQDGIDLIDRIEVAATLLRSLTGTAPANRP